MAERRVAGGSWMVAGVVAAAVAAVYATGIGGGFANSDEAIYGEFIRAMQRTGDYGTLRYQDTVLFQRPAVSVAMYALVAEMVPGEYGIRLLPTLFTVAGLLAIGLFVWRRTGSLAAGVVTVLFAAGIPSVYVYGRLVLSDPPFVLACLLAVMATMAAQDQPRWLPWAAIALGAAFAVKSLAAGIPAVALAPWLARAAWRHRRAPRWRRSMIVAVAGFLALAAPFYVVGLAQHGGEFWHQHFARVILARALGDLETIVGMGGPLSYARHIARADGVIVAGLLALAVVAGAVRAVRRLDSDLGVAVTYAAVVFVGLSLVNTRLAHYLLVFYPGAALCLGLCASPAIRWLAAALPVREGISRALAPVLAVTLFAHTIAQGSFDASTYPSPATETLAAAVEAAVPAGEPIYTLDWYAPALGYYADRVWHSLVTVPAVAHALANTDPFRYTGTIHGVPPWPPGALVIATERATLARTHALRVTAVLAEVPGDEQGSTYVLVRAVAAPE